MNTLNSNWPQLVYLPRTEKKSTIWCYIEMSHNRLRVMPKKCLPNQALEYLLLISSLEKYIPSSSLLLMPYLQPLISLASTAYVDAPLPIPSYFSNFDTLSSYLIHFLWLLKMRRLHWLSPPHLWIPYIQQYSWLLLQLQQCNWLLLPLQQCSQLLLLL